jgi:hypothetical protein
LDGQNSVPAVSDLICEVHTVVNPTQAALSVKSVVVYYQDNGGVRTYLWGEEKPDFLRRL